MTQRRVLRFPEGFLWGTASSSHQCEGGNTNNQWYRWEQQGRILSGEQCGAGANWWQAAEQDFERAEQMENNALRLSLEWSRVEPAERRRGSLSRHAGGPAPARHETPGHAAPLHGTTLVR